MYSSGQKSSPPICWFHIFNYFEKFCTWWYTYYIRRCMSFVFLNEQNYYEIFEHCENNWSVLLIFWPHLWFIRDVELLSNKNICECPRAAKWGNTNSFMGTRRDHVFSRIDFTSEIDESTRIELYSICLI